MTSRVIASWAALAAVVLLPLSASGSPSSPDADAPSTFASARPAKAVHRWDGTPKCVKKHVVAKKRGHWRGKPRQHCAKHAHPQPLPTPDPTHGPTPVPPTPAPTRLVVAEAASGLDHPWDVQALPSGRLLVTERSQLQLTLVDQGAATPVTFDNSSLWAAGETGLMGLELDPDFASNRRIYLCHGYDGGGTAPIDIRVTAWTLSPDDRSATPAGALVTGLPVATSGRHGGCRLLVLADGTLLIGTGDAASTAHPGDPASLGGKTLRVDRMTGQAAVGNPTIAGADPRVFSLRHRNVQGLAQRADGTAWSIEQGSDTDDEVNMLRPGGDYGWNPGSPYESGDEMTDHDLPGDQIDAAWSSGSPTLATSGGTFTPPNWGPWDGRLLVATLKASRLLALQFDTAGRFTDSDVVLTGHGRLRTAVPGPGGTVLVTTDNGEEEDKVLQLRME